MRLVFVATAGASLGIKTPSILPALVSVADKAAAGVADVKEEPPCKTVEVTSARDTVTEVSETLAVPVDFEGCVSTNEQIQQ